MSNRLTIMTSPLRERKGNDVTVLVVVVFRVSKVPQTLDELGDSLALWEELDADKPKIEAKFQPLYDQVICTEIS